MTNAAKKQSYLFLVLAVALIVLVEVAIAFARFSANAVLEDLLVVLALAFLLVPVVFLVLGAPWLAAKIIIVDLRDISIA